MKKFTAEMEQEKFLEGYAEDIEDAIQQTLDDQKAKAEYGGFEYIKPDELVYTDEDADSAAIFFEGCPTIYIYID